MRNGFLALCIIALSACDKHPEITRLREMIALQQREFDQAKQALDELQARLREQEGAPDPEASCTLESLRAKNADRISERDAENKRGREDHLAAVKEAQALRELASSLPAQPAGTPSLPGTTIESEYGLSVAHAERGSDGRCFLDFVDGESLAYEQPFHATWPELVAAAVQTFNQDGEAAEEDYQDQVDYLDGWFLKRVGGSSEWSEDMVKKGVKLFEDEGTLKAFGQWALPVLLNPAVLTDKTQNKARRWLRDFWTASHANLADLEAHVTSKEDYLYAKERKREGWFMRRWIAKGRGQSGNDMIAAYRALMAKAAGALKMPEAAAWSAEAKKSLVDAKTLKLKAWYAKQ